ncbi:MAG TPA: carotenoid oxygenase family protein [Gemmatales bacterium]|nr:carotenoid oxygenase family protein [Gemmatales bacterium]
MSLDRRDFLAYTGFATGLLVLGDLPQSLAQDTPPPGKPKSPFLEGNFAPVHEEVTADDLPVIGKLPAELDGMFVRNGPNPQFPPKGQYHWFDGDGMLHGVRIQGGRASYRNRYVRTAGWEAEAKAGKALFGGLADRPDLAKVMAGESPFKNAANTALVWHDGRLLALWEAGLPHAIRVPSLETVGPYNYGGKLKHPFTAHPKVDPETGEMFLFGYQFMAKPYVQYSVVNSQGELVRTVPIDIPQPVMMHDFALSERHAIFMDLPELFDLRRAMAGKHPLWFDKERAARFGILPRHGAAGDIRWFEAPPCYVFHVLNAYDDGDEVVLQACRSPEFPDILEFGTAHPSDEGGAQNRTVLYQWRFNLRTGRVAEGPLDDRSTEFPRVNDQRLGRRTRFGYAGQVGAGAGFSGLVKYDLDKGQAEQHDHGQGRFGGEGVFVPRPDAAAEDAGWLITFIHDDAAGKSELVVVDAQDFKAKPVARIVMPQRVPYGFHGAWVEGKHLG